MLADKGTVIVCDEPFTLIAIFPHPPSGWIHFATDNIEFLKDNFWRAIKRIGKNMVSLGINSLRIGLRERGEHEYVRLFIELGFKIYERIPIMEKDDYDIPDRGCQDVEIRRGTIEDVDALLEIENLYFPSGHRYSAEEFKKLISNPMFYVATHKGCVVGYLWLRVHDDTGQIIKIAVHPNYWKNCIGSRLMAFSIEKFSELKTRKIFTRTLKTLEYEIKLLKEYGFKHEENQITLEAKLSNI